MGMRFTCRGFAMWLLGTIEQPADTTDGGITTKKRVVEILEAAGYSAVDGQAMVTAWLDGGDQEVLLRPMTAGIKALHQQGFFRAAA